MDVELDRVDTEADRALDCVERGGGSLLGSALMRIRKYVSFEPGICHSLVLASGLTSLRHDRPHPHERDRFDPGGVRGNSARAASLRRTFPDRRLLGGHL